MRADALLEEARKGGFFSPSEDKYSAITYSTQFGGGVRVRF